MAGRKWEFFGFKDRGLIKNGRGLQILIVAVPEVHIVVDVVLAKRLAVVAHEHQKRAPEATLLLQSPIDLLDHPVQQIKVVVITGDQAAVLLQDPVIGVIKVGEMGCKAHVYSQEGFPGRLHPFHKKFCGLHLVPGDISAHRMSSFPNFEGKGLEAMDLLQAAVFDKTGWKVPSDGTRGNQETLRPWGKKVIQGIHLSVRPNAEGPAIKEIIDSAEDGKGCLGADVRKGEMIVEKPALRCEFFEKGHGRRIAEAGIEDIAGSD